MANKPESKQDLVLNAMAYAQRTIDGSFVLSKLDINVRQILDEELTRAYVAGHLGRGAQ